MAAIRRRVDELGRVVIPKKWRTQLELLPDTEVDIDLKGNKIIIQKAHETCAICGKLKREIQEGDKTIVNGKYIEESFVCHECITKIMKGGR